MVETKEEIFYTETFADDNSIVAYSLIWLKNHMRIIPTIIINYHIYGVL